MDMIDKAVAGIIGLIVVFLVVSSLMASFTNAGDTLKNATVGTGASGIGALFGSSNGLIVILLLVGLLLIALRTFKHKSR